MKSYRSFSVVILLSALFSASCAKTTAPPSSSSAGALTANSALNNFAARPFARHTLSGTGSSYLNEFLRPDVRARMDEEPTGDADGGYDPSTVDPGATSNEAQTDLSGEAQNEDAQQEGGGENDESYVTGSRLDTLKYSWARKGFGEAIKASPTNSGIIVLYADENTYDVERLMGFVEEGRNRIAQLSAVGGEKIQVVFGGYRAIPQVELWVVPQDGPMPEFKTDDRSKSNEPSN